jgi:hypothetical protein
MAQQNQPTHDEIRIRAYQIYLARGGDHGLDEQDWLQAEGELAAELNPRAASATAGASAGSTLKQEPGSVPKREAGVYTDPKASNAAAANPQRVESGGRGSRDRS